MKILCKDIPETDWKNSSTFILNNSHHLWLAEVHSKDQEISELRKFLSDDELKRSARFAFEKDRNQFIIAHGTLRNVLSKYIDTSPSQIQFKKTAERKPFISFPHTVLKFNISHSEHKILIGVSENEIGVDIEMVKDSFDFIQLSHSYFSEKEQKSISDSKNQKETFYKFWTRKESVLKAAGIGLIDNLREIEVCNGQNFSDTFEKDYCVSSFKIDDNFCGSIACSSESPVLFFKS